MAFDLLDNARTNISRTENAKLLCQCHYLSASNETDLSRNAFCPSDAASLLIRLFLFEDLIDFISSTIC